MILTEPLDEHQIQELHTAYHELETELTRLREADEVHWKTRRHLVGELARLREALEEIVALDGTWSSPHPSINIARNALKETT